MQAINPKELDFTKKFEKYYSFTSESKQVLYSKLLSSPLGEMIACADQKGIILLQFVDYPKLEQDFNYFHKLTNLPFIFEETPILHKLETELAQYFRKERKTFTVPLSIYGTPFQKVAWSALLNIPFGQTISYKSQSLEVGNEKAFRAVANANSKNKIAIVIPCHRVISSSGKLSGYAGGPWRKSELLQLES